MQDLTGKTAVVTGAASGIGAALARRLGAEGMRIVAADVDEARLAELVDELDTAGMAAIAVPTDVSLAEDNEALAIAADAFGPADLVVLNAGVVMTSGQLQGLLPELTLDDWEWILGVNLWGPIHGTRAFLPRLLEHGGGHLVYTSSMGALMPARNPYHIAKQGVHALADSVRGYVERAGAAIGVTVIFPGGVATGIASSEQHRPSRWGGAPDAVDAPATGDRRDAAALLASGVAKDPAEVADRVLAAVLADRATVLTDAKYVPEIKEYLDARFRTIAQDATAAEAERGEGSPGGSATT